MKTCVRFFFWMLAAMSVITTAAESQVPLPAAPDVSVSAADLGLDATGVLPGQRLGIQGLEVKAGIARVATTHGVWAVASDGTVAPSVEPKSHSPPLLQVQQLDPHRVALVSRFEVGLAPAAVLEAADGAVLSTVEVLPGVLGDGAVAVVIAERHGEAIDRRVVEVDLESGDVLGQARVPFDSERFTDGDVAVGDDGALYQARIEGERVVIKKVELARTLPAFAPPPAPRAPATDAAKTTPFVLASMTRAEVLREAAELARPRWPMNLSRLKNVPSTPCVVNGIPRIAPEPEDLTDGDLMATPYAWGGNATPAQFLSAVHGSSRYIGDLQSAFGPALPCPGGAAIGSDCSALVGQAWRSPAKFGTGNMVAAVGIDLGAMSTAQPGDAGNTAGHTVLIVRRISPGHVAVVESTARNGFDRVVNSVYTDAMLSGYRAVRRRELTGSGNTAAVIACSGCSQTSPGFFTATAGTQVTFRVTSPGSMSEIGWRADAAQAIGDRALHQRASAQPIVATGGSFSKAWTSSELGTHYISVGGSLSGGSVAYGYVQLTVNAPAPPPPSSGGSATLSNGVPVTNLAATSGNSLNYTMVVPSGATNLTFTISGGTGDADMYVRRGSAPTLSTHDCRPYLSGNSETCSFSAPSAGTYHVRLQAYTSFSGVRLVGSYATTTGGGGGATPDSTAPSRPGNLTATPASSSRIDLAWSASTDSGGSGLAGYKIERCQGSSCSNFSQIATTASTSYSASGLSAGTSYRFRVRAYDAAGNNSSYSSSATAMTAVQSGGGSGTQTYTNSTDYPIGDNTTVNSPITVSGRTGNAPSNSRVDVRIIHTWIGDLKVDLVAPDGSVYVLHNRSGGSADNIITFYTVNLSSELRNGTWKLRVNDNAAGDTGYIDSWKITL